MADSFGRITAAEEIIQDRFPPSRFVGRDWLIRAVRAVVDDEAARQFVIVGEPGSGKSALIAFLADAWNCPRHFIRTGSTTGVTGTAPRSFLCSIGAQLFLKYGPELFDRATTDTRVTVGLASGGSEVVGRYIDEICTLPFLPAADRTVTVSVGAAIRQSTVVGERIGRLIDVAEMLQPTELLHVTLLRPLKKLETLHPDETVVVLVDAIDEASSALGSPILSVLPRPDDADYPANLRLVMTSRRGNHLAQFSPAEMLQLDDVERGFKALQVGDTEKYLDQSLAASPLEEAYASLDENARAPWRAKLLERSDGNFLYLHHFLGALAAAIRTRGATIDEIPVPQDLDAIYRVFAIEKIKGQKGILEWQQVYLPILSVLAVAREPLARRLIEAIAAVDKGFVDYVVTELEQFLDTIEGPQDSCHGLYHRSFGEYLLDPARNRAYPIDGVEAHRRFTKYFKRGADAWADVPWQEDDDAYAFLHLPSHLVDGGETEELFNLLNASWIGKKLGRARNFNTLIPDFQLATSIASRATPPDFARVISCAVARQTAREGALNVSEDLLRAWVIGGKTDRAMATIESIVGPLSSLPRALDNRLDLDARSIGLLVGTAGEIAGNESAPGRNKGDDVAALIDKALDMVRRVPVGFRQVEIAERILSIICQPGALPPEQASLLLQIAADRFKRIEEVEPAVACLALVTDALRAGGQRQAPMASVIEGLLSRIESPADRLAIEGFMIPVWNAVDRQDPLKNLAARLEADADLFANASIVESPLGTVVRKWTGASSPDPPLSRQAFLQLANRVAAAGRDAHAAPVEFVHAFCALDLVDEAFDFIERLGGPATMPGARALFRCVQALRRANVERTRDRLRAAHEHLPMFNRLPKHLTFFHDYVYGPALALAHAKIGDWEAVSATIAAPEGKLRTSDYIEILRCGEAGPDHRTVVTQLVASCRASCLKEEPAEEPRLLAAASRALAALAPEDAATFGQQSESLSLLRLERSDLDPLRTLVSVGLHERGNVNDAANQAASVVSDHQRAETLRTLVQNTRKGDLETVKHLAGVVAYLLKPEGTDEALAQAPCNLSRLMALESVPLFYEKDPDTGQFLAKYLFHTTIAPQEARDVFRFVAGLAAAFVHSDPGHTVSWFDSLLQRIEDWLDASSVFEHATILPVFEALGIACAAAPDQLRSRVERLHELVHRFPVEFRPWLGAESAMLFAHFDCARAAAEFERCIDELQKIEPEALDRHLTAIAAHFGEVVGAHAANAMSASAVADCLVRFAGKDAERAGALFDRLLQAILRITSPDDQVQAIINLLKASVKGPPALQPQLAEVYSAILQHAGTLTKGPEYSPKNFERSARIYDELIRCFASLGLAPVAEKVAEIRRLQSGRSVRGELPIVIARSGVRKIELSAFDREYIGKRDSDERWMWLCLTRMQNQGEKLLSSFLSELGDDRAGESRRQLLQRRVGEELMLPIVSVGGLDLAVRAIDAVEQFDDRFEAAVKIATAAPSPVEPVTSRQ